MDRVDKQILKRAKELQSELSEDGHIQPLEDCIEMAITEKKWYEMAW
jgi:hypothetical protein